MTKKRQLTEIENEVLETLELYVGNQTIFFSNVTEALGIDYLSLLQINHIVASFLKKYPEYHEYAMIDRKKPLSDQCRIYYTVLSKRAEEPSKYMYAQIIQRSDERQIGERLRMLRKDAGISIVELARRTGIGVRTIENYELGKRRLEGASADYVQKIADELHVLIDEIIS